MRKREGSFFLEKFVMEMLGFRQSAKHAFPRQQSEHLAKRKKGEDETPFNVHAPPQAELNIQEEGSLLSGADWAVMTSLEWLPGNDTEPMISLDLRAPGSVKQGRRGRRLTETQQFYTPLGPGQRYTCERVHLPGGQREQSPPNHTCLPTSTVQLLHCDH